MNSRPKLLFYCQHALGIGHFVRALALARGLAAHFELTFLNGGLVPPELSFPTEELTLINLPPLGFDLEMRLCSRDSRYTVEQAQELRRELILRTFEELQPQIVLIELFPFGRKKFASELLPLLERARSARPQSVVACSLRDILVSRSPRHDQLAAEQANLYFDAVLVHADPRFARIEESFHPTTPLQVPVFYTGFVPRVQDDRMPAEVRREPGIVVSAGGGIVGEPLLRNAVLAHDIIREHLPLPMKIIAGPFLPEEQWQALQEMSAGRPGLCLCRSVPDLPSELECASASVSQCGYNTALEVLRSGIPALFVPFATEEEDEQMSRARRLERLGAARVLDPAQLTPDRLASEIVSLSSFEPRSVDLDMSGTEKSARILSELTERARASALKIAPKPAASEAGHWLRPLRQVLEKMEHPVQLFFRDDDAGWADERLLQLLDLFADHAVPIDLAAIPMELTSPLVRELARRAAKSSDHLHAHQHGCRHRNYEPAGKKCEFGPARSYLEQRDDLLNGRQRLTDLLEFQTDPIFTPPWNRCTEVTASCLSELGFVALSRDAGATPLANSRLLEIPITIDWFACKHGVPVPRHEWATLLASKLSAEPLLGIMLHHALMDIPEREALAALLGLFAGTNKVRRRTMLDLASDRAVHAGAPGKQGMEEARTAC